MSVSSNYQKQRNDRAQHFPRVKLSQPGSQVRQISERNIRQSMCVPTLALLIWFAVSIVATATAFVATGGPGLSEWADHFWPILRYWALWTIVSPLIFYVVNTMSISGIGLVVFVLSHAAILVAVTVLVPIIVFYANPIEWLLTAQARTFHALNIPTYGFVVVGCYLLKHYQTSQVNERRAALLAIKASDLEAALARARLDVLRAQVNPHFLFNALNSIGALVESSRGPQAYRAIESLGRLLRLSVAHSEDNRISLEEQMDVVREYIDIEKLRYTDRLHYVENIDPLALTSLVPTQALLVVVENAVKHAVDPEMRPITISVNVEQADDRLHIVVADDGPGFGDSGTSPSLGHGLSGLRERLLLQYGDDCLFEVSSAKSGGVRVRFEFPSESRNETACHME